MALCRLIPRKQSVPRLVALVPSLEKYLFGFHVIYLPYLDDVRTLDSQDIPRKKPVEDTELLNSMTQSVKKLMISDFDFDFVNPELLKFYQGLESFALNMEDYDIEAEYKDPTLSNVEWMISEAGNEWEKVKNLLQNRHFIHPRDTELEMETDRAVVKKPKTTSSLSVEEVQAKWTQGKLKSLTVAQLQGFLKSVGLKSTGKKDELMESVYSYFCKQ